MYKWYQIAQRITYYKILNALKLFWFTVDSFVLFNEGVQFFFHDICHFFVCIADCLFSRNLKANSKSFEYFLPTVISHFICSPCLRKKYGSLHINFRTRPTATESLLDSCINDPGKVKNDEFLKKIMNSVKDKVAGEEEELLEMKILFHVYIRLIMIII